MANEAANSTNAAAHGSPEWAHAMELFVGQLATVLECEGRNGFTVGALQRWSDLCAQRMHETGSVPPTVIAHLRGIAARVAA
ncbi:hypothetical protein [Delftia acidovorans]